MKLHMVLLGTGDLVFTLVSGNIENIAMTIGDRDNIAYDYNHMTTCHTAF